MVNLIYIYCIFIKMNSNEADAMIVESNEKPKIEEIIEAYGYQSIDLFEMI